MKKILLTSILFVLLSSRAFAINIATGSYVGSGVDNRNISGLGFQPDFVLIRGHGSFNGGALRTSTMAGDSSFNIPAGGLQANYIQSLSADGFQVGTADDVNLNGFTFSYIAIKADTSNFKVGSYTGDGLDNHAITGVGFQPSGCYVRHASNSFVEGFWHTSDMPSDTSYFIGDSSNSSSGLIKTLDSDGFTLGTQPYANTSADTYYYACWKDSSGLMKTGTYTGNATDDRSISGVGFFPDFVMVQGASGFAQAHLPGQTDSDDTTYRFYLSGAWADTIQAKSADGFQIGTSANINTNASPYYYWSLKDGGATGGGVAVSGLPNSLL